MRKFNNCSRLVVLMLFMTFFCFGCKGESDVVAQYKNGNITRGEMYDWIEVKARGRDDILKKKSFQEKILREMAITRIAVSEATESKFNDSPDYKKLEDLVRMSFLSGYYRKKISDKLPFKEEAVRIRLIRLDLQSEGKSLAKNRRANPDNNSPEIRKQIEKALELKGRIEKGESFEDIAKKESRDYTAKNGGDTGYLVSSMRSPAVMKAAFALKEGEISQPVVDRGGVYLIRLEDKTQLTDSNIDSVIDDKKKAERLKRRLSAAELKKHEESLSKEFNASFNIEAIKKGIGKGVVFTVAGNDFTFNDLKAIQRMIDERNNLEQSRKDVSMYERLARRLYLDRILVAAAKKKNFHKDAECAREWSVYSQLTLAGIYMHDIIAKDVKVTPKEIRDEFLRMKKSALDAYKKNSAKSKKRTGGFSFPTFAEFSKRYSPRIIMSKKRSLIGAWQEKALKERAFTINKDSLEGN